MVILTDIKAWLIRIGLTDNIYLGRYDTNAKEVLCLYNRNSNANWTSIGGQSGSGNKRIAILFHWNKSYSSSEVAANNVYRLLLSKVGEPLDVNGKQCFINMVEDSPISVGADENGVYEFIIDFNIMYKR